MFAYEINQNYVCVSHDLLFEDEYLRGHHNVVLDVGEGEVGRRAFPNYITYLIDTAVAGSRCV